LPILQQFGLFDRDRIANTDGPATVTYSRSSSSKCARNLASRWFRINIRNTDFGIQQGAAGSAVFDGIAAIGGRFPSRAPPHTIL
jgi:hypothetical protein